MNAESSVKETKEGPSVKRFRSEGDFQTKMSEMFDNEDFAGFGDDDLEFSPIADEEQKVRGKKSFLITTNVHPVPPWCE